MKKIKKANEIIEERNKLSIEISRYWGTIRIENVVNRNYTRNYDLKALYENIKNLANRRIEAKLEMLCINMGLKSYSDLPEVCNQRDVFRLSELNEIFVQLGQIKTINPKLKAQKGKNNLNKTEALTSNWIAARKNEIELEITNLKNKLTEFNEKAELEVEVA